MFATNVHQLPRAKALILVLSIAIAMCAACGGNNSVANSGSSGSAGGDGSTGGSSGSVQAAPSFTFTFSVPGPSVQLQQGGSTGSNGIETRAVFSGTGSVQVSFQNLPPGITTIPATPFTLGSGSGQGQQDVTFYAAPSTPLGSSTITATALASDGSSTQSATFTLTVNPAAPFSLNLSTNNLTVGVGSQSTFIATVTSSSGTLNTTNLFFNVLSPPSTGGLNLRTCGNYSITPTTVSCPIQINAGSTAPPLQNYAVLVTATLGSNNAAQVLSLTVNVPYPPVTALTRSTFKATDEDVTAAVYDRSRKLVFATVEALNEVLVFSSTNGGLIATIPVGRPQAIDEAIDDSKIYVGTWASQIAVIDPDLFQVVQSEQPLDPSLSPAFIAVLSNGKVLILASNSNFTSALYLWDPVSNSVTNENISPFVPASIIRSADHSKVLLAGNLPGTALLYEASSNTFSQSPFPVSASAGASALSPNGTQLATFDGQSSVVIYNDQFQQLASLPIQSQNDLPQNLIYSLDGRYLYDLSSFYPESPNIITAIDATTFKIVGLAPDFTFNALSPTVPFGIDETGMIFGSVPGARGLNSMDVSHPGAFQFPVFGLSYPAQFTPTLLSTSVPVQTAIAGGVFDPTSQYTVSFGAPPASASTQLGTNVTFQSSNFLQVTAPPGASPGVSNVTVSRSDGWYQIAPDAVTFGPQIFGVDANSGPTSGGSKIQIFGLGFFSQDLQVMIGPLAATVTNLIGPGDSGTYPVNVIEVMTPQGLPGPADVTVITSSGSTTLPGGFQYFDETEVYTIDGAPAQVVYDQQRQRLYVTNTTYNRVEVFYLPSRTFLPPIPVGKQPEGIALSPDGAKLAVVNSGDGTVSVIDPGSTTVLNTFSVLTSDDSLCGGRASAITAIKSQRVLVVLTCTAESNVTYTHLLDLNSGSLSCVAIPGCTGTIISNGGTMASTPDGSKLAFISGIIDLNTDTKQNMPRAVGIPLTLNADGSIFTASDTSNLGFPVVVSFDSQLAEGAALQSPSYAPRLSDSSNPANGASLNASGSLFFHPEQTLPSGQTLGIEIFDVHEGRLAAHIALPDSVASVLGPMAVDENSETFFLISNTGLTIAHPGSMPLSIASANPPSGAAGVQTTIRGSGFKTGATVTFGATVASATFVDSETLTATVPPLPAGALQVTVTNPDGQKYGFDDLFTIQ